MKKIKRPNFYVSDDEKRRHLHLLETKTGVCVCTRVFMSHKPWILKIKLFIANDYRLV